jgi:dihydropyrimidinase
MVDLVINNGKIVFPHDTLKAAIAINDGKIVAIGASSMMPKSDRTINANGNFVLPGGIDPHVHIHTPFMGATTNDDFFLATKAVSAGGTTTIIDFATQEKGKSPMEAVQARQLLADGNVVIDYSLHPTITDLHDESSGELEKLVNYGTPSFKLFLVYRAEGLMVDDGTLLKVFEAAKAYGGLVGLHAENIAMIDQLRSEALRQGHKEAVYHALTRPPITEAEAVNRAIFLANYFKAPYYNFHLSIKEGVDMFREARRRGLPMYAETCTHYLVQSTADLQRSNGINFICTPPLRTEEHQEALWQGLADTSLSLVSSDHCAFTTTMKKLGEESFDKVPNGMPGLEFRIPIIFSEGVGKGRITINRFSEIISTNAAKIFGLYPKKGIIAIGSDADLVILDPHLEKTITTDDSLYDMDWYPYEGRKVKGYPTLTISKGRIIWEDGEFQGKQGDGVFLKRTLAPELFNRPIA